MLDYIGNTWDNFIKSEMRKEYFKSLKEFLKDEYDNKNIFPPKKDVLKAFYLTSLNDIKVVILGQDPYYKKNQADGLAFSVKKDQNLPKSLKNIYSEIKQNNYHSFDKSHGNLEGWANQGVFLLNTVLTVEESKPNSHKSKGWEIFTKEVIKYINNNRKNIIFVLWGRYAQSFRDLIDSEKHFILESSHPSPLAAHISFKGSKHFLKINNILNKIGSNPIDWNL